MSDVKQIVVQVAGPGRRYKHGAVTFGYYTVDDGIVTMTDKDGIPAGVETGKTFSHKLKRDEDPREWAARMTKELRSEFKGGKDRVVAGFDGPIPYPKLPKFM
jgi:hypothetical protein